MDRIITEAVEAILNTTRLPWSKRDDLEKLLKPFFQRIVGASKETEIPEAVFYDNEGKKYSSADIQPPSQPDAKDTERLDWLDECNRRLNAHCGTNYGWEVILSSNVTRLMLESPYVTEFAGVDINDMKASGKKTVRAAIDSAMAASKTK